MTGVNRDALVDKARLRKALRLASDLAPALRDDNWPLALLHETIRHRDARSEVEKRCGLRVCSDRTWAMVEVLLEWEDAKPRPRLRRVK